MPLQLSLVRNRNVKFGKRLHAIQPLGQEMFHYIVCSRFTLRSPAIKNIILLIREESIGFSLVTKVFIFVSLPVSWGGLSTNRYRTPLSSRFSRTKKLSHIVESKLKLSLETWKCSLMHINSVHHVGGTWSHLLVTIIRPHFPVASFLEYRWSGIKYLDVSQSLAHDHHRVTWKCPPFY